MTGREPGPASKFAPVRIDLRHATLDQHAVVREYLADRRVYHEFVGDILIVPLDHAEHVRSALATARAQRVPVIRGRLDDGGGTLRAVVTAGPGRRLAGACADWVLLSLCVVVAGLWVSIRAAAGISACAGVLIAVVGIGAVGRTPGKWLLRTLVVDSATGRRAGWAAALVRGLVPMVPGLAVETVWWSWPGTIGRASWLIGLLGWCAVFAPILGAERRGLHDRMAHTVVIRQRPSRPLSAGAKRERQR